MSKSKIEHGSRNQTLSKKLFDESIYLDWTITTAFYSAIHFVEDKLLPCQVNENTCNRLSDVKKAYNVSTLHDARLNLVEDKAMHICVKYKWLQDQSKNARYISYKTGKLEAEKALKYLEDIVKECQP